MKITTAAEMSAIDRATNQHHGVDSLSLMENAGSAVADFARERWPAANRITVVCGKGNNGGDGLVAARRLHAAGKVVEVLLLGPAEWLKADAASMLARLPLRPILVTSAEEFARNYARSLAGADLIVDAIFGTGYTPRQDSSQAQELAESVIVAINAVSVPVLSVDLPSGWNADTTSSAQAPRSAVCRSCATMTFTAPKPAHLFAPLTRGTIVVAAIGTPEAAIISAENLYAVTPREVAAFFGSRALDSNKGRFGHALVAGGSLGKSGAAAMCGMAEGLGEEGSRYAVPGDAARCLELAKSRDVLAIGPGLSRRPGVEEFVHRLVRGAHCPVVLDADGLNAYAGAPEGLQGGSRPLILTPHPGEMARLTGQSVAEVQADRVGAARAFARRHHCIVVLKGFRTVIAYPGGDVWVVATGNPGMATGGTGDILTGMIAGAVAQFPGHLEEAVRSAVFLHGLAGDVAAEHMGEESMVATDLLRYLPVAFRKMRQRARGKYIPLR
jgi:ADP-dependent NAD(P)H-hydrate dehydratase / NAD(P)H-hydrate epimerase